METYLERGKYVLELFYFVSNNVNEEEEKRIK